MPCRDYESDSWGHSGDSGRVGKLKEQADRLARMACSAMEELEANGIAEVLLLKNDELREWWTAHKEADRKEKARVAELERKERVKSEALASLSDEAKELLGLAPKKSGPAQKSLKKSSTLDEFDEDADFLEWDRQEREFEKWEAEIQEEIQDLEGFAQHMVKTYKLK